MTKFDSYNFKIITPENLSILLEATERIINLWEAFNSESITAMQLAKRIVQSNSILLIADDLTLSRAGFAIFTPINTPIDNRQRIELYALYVQPAMRKFGIGRKMMKVIEEYGSSIGCGGIHVSAARKYFFEKSGFIKYKGEGRYFKGLPFIA